MLGDAGMGKSSLMRLLHLEYESREEDVTAAFLTDPEVLALAAAERRVLVSHDRRTLPGHFREFVASQSSPGLIIVSRKLAVGRAAELLHLLWAASEAEEYVNVIYDLP